ncbi:MAG TPA: tRNA pseudouridine(55) synthase TruB, partial [Bacillales bacterium]|nr:tRNA pseudouridine(55) synthase TruB [Bacillales bacterium]
MNGILPLYKPVGLTSHDCVYYMRKWTGQRKIGHTGTLDPGAEGVLPLCFGTATKAVPYLTEDDKEYEAEVTLGTATITEDAEGEIVSEKKIDTPPDVKQLKEALLELTGTIQQVPPMYSAVKVNGRKLYEYAREGKEVERPKRTVTVYELELLDEAISFIDNRISFWIRVRCSKGTYIRTLAVDVGKSLGFPAHMSSLVRTRSGIFSSMDCIPFRDAEQRARDGDLEKFLFSMDQALASFPQLIVDEDTESKVAHGAVLPLPERMQ